MVCCYRGACLSIALIFSGRVIFQFFPAVEGDRIYATLVMPQGINVEYTEIAAEQLEDAASKQRDKSMRSSGTKTNPCCCRFFNPSDRMRLEVAAPLLKQPEEVTWRKS